MTLKPRFRQISKAAWISSSSRNEWVLHLRLPASCKTAVKDDRLDIVFGQFPFDPPYHLPAPFGIGFGRLRVDEFV